MYLFYLVPTKNSFVFVYLQDIANKIAHFMKFVQQGDHSKLQAVRESVLQMNAPLSLVIIML